METGRGRNTFSTGPAQCDIVGYLPLELVIQVVKCLDLVDIVQCQRVWQC